MYRFRCLPSLRLLRLNRGGAERQSAKGAGSDLDVCLSGIEVGISVAKVKGCPRILHSRCRSLLRSARSCAGRARSCSRRRRRMAGQRWRSQSRLHFPYRWLRRQPPACLTWYRSRYASRWCGSTRPTTCMAGSARCMRPSLALRFNWANSSPVRPTHDSAVPSVVIGRLVSQGRGA
jgi:hypothetical protein